MTAMFVPERLRLARQRRGLTLTKLSEISGISTRTLSSYENDEYHPPQESLDALAGHLSVLPEFFQRESIDVLPPETVSFRKLSKTTAAKRDAALAAATITLEFADWIHSKFVLPNPTVPTLDKLDPETAADVIRTRWGLGVKPISNMVHLLEAHGVRVFNIAAECREIDAFSFYRDEVPYIFLSTDKTGERQRFDAAHELGHLVLHSDGGQDRPQGRAKEAEANRFAAALLMPADGVLSQSMRNATLDRILAARSYWRVSAMAMTHRLRELELLTEWMYRSTCVTLSEMGYRKAEPGGIVPETSQVLRKVLFNTEVKSATRQASDYLQVPPSEIRSHIAGLVPTAA